MDIEKLGCNIRLLREGKGLTREQFCEGENELSVRQLMRIEKGESTPTLAKLVFIAGKLGISVTALFNESESIDTVPQEYWNLKHEVENYNSFDEEEKECRLAILMKIYDHYYDGLPREEQMFVDCTMTLNDIYESKDLSFLMTTINKYDDVLEKETFCTNDFVYLSIYLIFQAETKKWKDKNEKLIGDLLKQLKEDEKSDAEAVIRIYINIMTYYIAQGNYSYTIKIANDVIQCINLNKAYQRLPIIYMLLAKSYIGLNDKQVGLAFYKKALNLSELLQINSLKLKIQQEMDKDV